MYRTDLRGSERGEEVPTLLRMISGARYSGVPHKVQVRPFTRLAKPKSVTCRHKSRVGREGGRFQAMATWGYP